MELSRRSLALGLAGLFVSGAARAERGGELYLQPLGAGLDAEGVAMVKEALEAVYAPKVRLLERAELPRAAFYVPRKRYRAEKLLDFLRPRLPEGGLRIVGLTASDISTTKGEYFDWGILGLATVDGEACVLSSFRCKRRAKSVAHARVRFAKTAVHEIGHTFGLEHCPARGCLMEDGAGSVLTTDRERDLCDSCRKKLAGRGALRVPGEALPW